MITKGKFDHKNNPIDLVQGGKKIGEATGEEVILNKEQQSKIAKESPYFKALVSEFKKSGNKKANRGMSMEELEKVEQQQMADAINSGVNSGLSQVPVYGAYYGAARSVAGVVQDALPEDNKGEKQSGFVAGIDNLLTPSHELWINDAAEGDWLEAGVGVLTSGVYNVIEGFFE